MGGRDDALDGALSALGTLGSPGAPCDVPGESAGIGAVDRHAAPIFPDIGWQVYYRLGTGPQPDDDARGGIVVDVTLAGSEPGYIVMGPGMGGQIVEHTLHGSVCGVDDGGRDSRLVASPPERYATLRFIRAACRDIGKGTGPLKAYHQRLLAAVVALGGTI